LLGQAATGAIATYLWWPISSAHQALFWTLVVLVALHLSGAALSFAIRPGETLFRITGLRLAR
jgi:cytochrome b561